MRLADVVFAHGVTPPPSILEALSEEGRRNLVRLQSDYVRDFVRLMPIITIDNAYRYVKASDFTGNNQYLYDLPSIAPPFPAVWAEWMQDNGKPVGVQVTVEDGPFDVEGLPVWDEAYENNLRWLRRPKDAPIDVSVAFSDGRDTSRWVSDNLDVEGWKQVRWLWGLDFYQGDGRDGVFGPLFSVLVAANERGRMLDIVFKAFTSMGAYQGWIVTFLQAMAFLHCRNVNLVKITPPPALSKKHRRKGKITQDLVSYHIIEVDPFGQPRNSSKAHQARAESRLHIARGSFHHYGDCCPDVHPPKGLLFGKHEGVYWVPQHVRGNPERGIVVSDYRIGEIDG